MWIEVIDWGHRHTFSFHNLSRKAGKYRLARVRVHIKLLRRQAEMLNDLLEESRIRSPLISGSASIEDSVLNGRRLVGELV